MRGELAASTTNRGTKLARPICGELVQSAKVKFPRELAQPRCWWTKGLASSSPARHIHLAHRSSYLYYFMIRAQEQRVRVTSEDKTKVFRVPMSEFIHLNMPTSTSSEIIPYMAKILWSKCWFYRYIPPRGKLRFRYRWITYNHRFRIKLSEENVLKLI